MEESKEESKTLKSKCMNKVLDRVLKMMFKNSIYKNVDAFKQEMEERKNIKNSSSILEKYKFKVPVEQSDINGMKLYKLMPNDIKNSKVILYLHGGAYVEEITKQHLRLLEILANKTGSRILIPLYKLAPIYTYKDTYEDLLALYNKELSNLEASNIVFMGDSAGGGLALGLAQYLAELNERVPEELYLISPWLDISMSMKEQMKDIEKLDLILGIDSLEEAGRLWTGNSEILGYKLSPINGSFEKLTKISIFTGTHDILNLDARRLRDKIKSTNIELSYYEEEGLPHVFPILPLEESKKFVEIVANKLNEIEK